MSETDEQRIERIARCDAADIDEIAAAEEGLNAIVASEDDLNWLLTHARRSVEAEAAKGEYEAAYRAARADDVRVWAPAHPNEIKAALAAAAIWRAAHPVPVVIDAAIVALLTPLDAFLKIVEEEVGVHANCADEPDDSSVGYSAEGDMPMTFGHVRCARKAINGLRDALTAALNPQEPTP